ncbi:hypothetical protein M404DRAFT_189470 [Pisolithus tinctorius Marx 270]|uniref:Uncharacterized protein n=1 Tax=Pisolithus tinctorius Marx 270 TaxID=870435 RepID=A0A0C3K0F0_PISTI|nr:hypothetical protein M404DRAFT_189470 [Pisolithus tinctorius Marx 270]
MRTEIRQFSENDFNGSISANQPHKLLVTATYRYPIMTMISGCSWPRKIRAGLKRSRRSSPEDFDLAQSNGPNPGASLPLPSLAPRP